MKRDMMQGCHFLYLVEALVALLSMSCLQRFKVWEGFVCYISMDKGGSVVFQLANSAMLGG
jgi:hypothetical protein